MIDLIGDILYEDNQVLVAVKPPNMLSQADRTGDPDILSVLKNYIKEKYHKPGNGDDRQESRSSDGNCHADEPAGITQLSRP